MQRYLITISENHPTRPGFIERFYARIEVMGWGSDFVWQQIDASGRPVGNQSQPFRLEGDALKDAVNRLHGERWEAE